MKFYLFIMFFISALIAAAPGDDSRSPGKSPVASPKPADYGADFPGKTFVPSPTSRNPRFSAATQSPKPKRPLATKPPHNDTY